MPNINLDDAYILDETGAQVDKVTGLFTKDEDTTSGEKAFAQLNIGVSGSNDNLVENGWFTVRQRGDGPFTSGNTVDRWKVVGGSPSITGRSGYGIHISASSTFAIDQEIDAPNAAWLSKTFTLSVMIDGVVNSASGSYSQSPYIGIDMHVDNLRFMLIYSATRPAVRIYGEGTTEVDIDAVKLEPGSISTLANDVPQNDELKCLKYQELIQNVAYNYIPIGFGAFAGGNTIRMFIPTAVPMNAASLHASVPITGAVTVGGNGTTIGVASIVLVGVLRTGVYVNVNLNSAPTTGHTYSLMLGDGASILIDCNL